MIAVDMCVTQSLPLPSVAVLKREGRGRGCRTDSIHVGMIVWSGHEYYAANKGAAQARGMSLNMGTVHNVHYHCCVH